MPAFTDQLGRAITLSHPPSRIVSLVPSQTELLATLEAPVVGITKFCVHPASWFRELTRIGGTKDIHPEKIAALQPDLIIANKEENDRAQVETLAAQYPVWVSDIHDLHNALTMIRSIGDLIGRGAKAQSLATTIQSSFNDLHPTADIPQAAQFTLAAHSPQAARSPVAAYLIWRTAEPLSFMAAGNDTFIHDMLQRCGLANHFANRPRYPAVTPNDLAACDLILLSSEPYPFRDRHITELRALTPHAAIRLVDGEMFSWYGSRLLHAPAYFRQLLDDCQSGLLKKADI
jgi:ABC-type Fe3+-hydroxamate transport system substrate-binding protein